MRLSIAPFCSLNYIEGKANKQKGAIMSDSKVVASKVKTYVKEKSGMNTSTTVFDALTRIVEREIDKAIVNAERNKRKTVMDRDFM